MSLDPTAAVDEFSRVTAATSLLPVPVQITGLLGAVALSAIWMTRGFWPSNRAHSPSNALQKEFLELIKQLSEESSRASASHAEALDANTRQLESLAKNLGDVAGGFHKMTHRLSTLEGRCSMCPNKRDKDKES